MDVRLSAEQVALRDSVARVVADLGPRAVGELDDAARRAKLDAAVRDAGWRELRIAGDGGAPLASAVEVAIVAEQLGRGLADVPFIGAALAADLRRRARAPEATSTETVALDRRLSSLLCVAVDAPSRGDAVDAAGADHALVVTPARGGHALGRIDVSTAAPTDSSDAVDLTRPTVPLAAVPAVPIDGQGAVIADPELDRVVALGLAAASADLVGVMQGATELARDYAVERQQYGSAIGSFQAVQHLLADALALTEGARSTVLHAAWAVDALAPSDALHAAHVAKAYCGRAARTVCETSIQVHGGIGNTWECLAHVYLRRALVSTELLGGVGASLDAVLAHHGIGAD